MHLHGKNFIGDQFTTGSGEIFRAISPLDCTPLEPDFHHADIGDVALAMTLAESAFESYRLTSGPQRGDFLHRIADEIVALGDDLLQRAHLESGLPIARLTGERGRTVGQLRLFAQVVREGTWVDARIDTAEPDRQPLPKVDLRRMLIPIGPVIVFGSSNFPLAFSTAGGDTASALATGNPVVVKAHGAHPGTGEMVATAIHRAIAACGMPPGVFSMLHGSGQIIGTELVKHPFARACGFTGSRAAGRALFDAAAARPEPIPVFAEMASLNPVFILPGALQENSTKLAEDLRTSITAGVGQFCTKPGVIFGIESVEFGQFRQTLAELLEKVAPATMLHAGISDAYHQGLAHVTSLPGVAPLACSAESPDPHKTHGEVVALTTDVENFLKHDEFSEEVFGPFSLLVSAGSLAEMEHAARLLQGQLTATVHGTLVDLEQAAGLLHLLERKAGRLIVNGYPTGVEVCPSMNHGGPYPATTDVRFTSVGTAALERFIRPVSYQNFPQELLPDALKDGNPAGIRRMVNGVAE